MTKIWFYRQFFIFSIMIIAVFNMARASYVPGEMIIKFKGEESKNLKIFLDETGVKVDKKIPLLAGDIYLIKLDQKADIEKLSKDFSKMPQVQYAEPNFIYKIDDPIDESLINNVIFGESSGYSYVPNDPKFNILWGLNNTGSNDPTGIAGAAGADIDALKAWEITTGNREIKIAVIDTGIDYNHPDLRDNIWVNEIEKNGKPGVDDDKNGYVDDIHGYDFANKDGDPIDDNNHGTHCAGTIGAVHNNNEGVAGIMDAVTLVPLKFLSANGGGVLSDAVQAIDYGTRLGVDIMSNSWGGGPFSQALLDAIKQASTAGIIFVAAAGNSTSDNDQSEQYPSNYEVDGLIAVASHTNADHLSSFSSYGKRNVDIAAPGSNIYSTIKGGGYDSFSGTSMATPHVSGALGLMLSHTGRLPHLEMRERVLMTSDYVNSYVNKVVSNGRLNVYNLITDTRPERPWEPDENDWIAVPLTQVFETAHPYKEKETLERIISIPGAKMIRVKFDKFQTEAKYDYVMVAGKDGNELERLSGIKQGIFHSSYVRGDTVKLKFVSDFSITHWGFLISEVEVIYNIPQQ